MLRFHRPARQELFELQILGGGMIGWESAWHSTQLFAAERSEDLSKIPGFNDLLERLMFGDDTGADGSQIVR